MRLRFLPVVFCLPVGPALAQGIEARCAALGAVYNMALGMRAKGVTEAEVQRQTGATLPATEACHLNRVVRRALLSDDKMSRATEAAWTAECIARDPPLPVCN